MLDNEALRDELVSQTALAEAWGKEVERLSIRTIGWLALHVTDGDEDAARRVWEEISA